MPHMVSRAKVDEVSSVDLPANQHGLFVLTKRAAPEETQVEYFDADGQQVDIQTLPEGSWVQDENQNPFQVHWSEEDDDQLQQAADEYGDYEQGGDDELYDGARERELQEVGKSAFLNKLAKRGDDVFANISKALSSAIADDSARTQIAKAFSDQQVQLSKAEQRAEEAWKIAKAAQDREETRVYIAKASEYDVPVAPEVLGPVLMRMSKALSYEDCAVVATLLENTGDIFKQYGIDGGGDTDDVFDQVEKYMAENASDVLEELGKRGYPAGTGPERGASTRLSKEAATVAFFDMNPREYTLLKRNRRG